jgi:hypothetical protein
MEQISMNMIFRCLVCAFEIFGLESHVATSKASHLIRPFQIKHPSSLLLPLCCLHARMCFTTYNVTSFQPAGEPALLEHGAGQLVREVLLSADLAFLWMCDGAATSLPSSFLGFSVGGGP